MAKRKAIKRYVFWSIMLLSIMFLGYFIFRFSVFENKSGKLNIVTTLFPVYDMAKNIGGEKISVKLLLPPGTEAHTYEPTPKDILEIKDSSIFIFTNPYLESWVADMTGAVGLDEDKILNASNNIKFIKGDTKESLDPHVWLDFDNAKAMATNIYGKLAEKDPENEPYYREKLDNYLLSLTNLDFKYRQELENCKQKTLVHGGHFAFGYLAKKYNLTYISAIGFSPDAEPTAQDLKLIVENIRKNGIKYIYYEELTSPKISQTISSETGAEMLYLSAAHNMSKKDILSDKTFLSVMEDNLKNIKIGLECD